MSYPRTCRNGHTINGAADETHPPGGHRQCRECRLKSQAGADARHYALHSARRIAQVRAYQATPAGVLTKRRADAKYDASTKGIVRRVRAELSAAYRALETM